MNEHRAQPSEKFDPSAPPIVSEFIIHGLYGYRTIGLSAGHAATILIAKNGLGKTTLLAALDAFLRRQFSRLKDINFESIVCQFHSLDKPIELRKADLESVFSFPESSEIERLARRIEVNPTELIDFLERNPNVARTPSIQYRENRVYMGLLRECGFSHEETRKLCQSLKASLYDSSPPITLIAKEIEVAMKGIEIVYLPTYRRVELPLTDRDYPIDSIKRRRSNPQISELGLPSGIQFGLADISERLEELNHRLLAESNQSYRRISASIIHEMLNRKLEDIIASIEDIPTKDELTFFFSRLREGNWPADLPSDIAIPDLDKIYETTLDPSTNPFLIYFLRKLNNAIQATREIETMVEQFVENCNKYLSFDDRSIESLGLSKRRPTNDDRKLLRLDRRNLRVHVESAAGQRRISLNALSSGEKQMISVFAKLYLYPNRKIVLIDEPELSLSIDWQREILVDVLSSPLCEQLIAITHSPFVFENRLEPYARSLSIKVDLDKLSEATNDDFLE